MTGETDAASQFGIFNPILLDHKIYLHLSIQDEQVFTMRKEGACKIIFQDILGILPSRWVDAKYAGAATTYYRYAEISSQVRLIESPDDQVKYLNALMKHYQPEGKFEKIASDSPVYGNSLKSILIAEFRLDSIKAKWKLGQNRSVNTRRRVAENFRQSGNTRCAGEIERWIEKNETEGPQQSKS